MPSQVLEGSFPSVAQSDEWAHFLADMTAGLHTVAQPLTILRAAVAASATPGISPTKQRRYLDLSTAQIARACILFEYLQDLVTARQIEADCAPIDLSVMVSTVARDQKAALQGSCIELEVLMPGVVPMPFGDASRTLQAILAGLKVATLISVPGDVIQLVATLRDQHVELVIRNDRVRGAVLGSSERLSLSLAKAHVLSQKGEYEYAEDPFWTRLALPLFSVKPAYQSI